jgi:hypothetical protein
VQYHYDNLVPESLDSINDPISPKFDEGAWPDTFRLCSRKLRPFPVVSPLPAADITVNFGSGGRRQKLALFSLAANNPVASDQSVMLT